ncbi:unnamed protein product [Moneuplotes crassus]|uniref:Uncharacterized protein n=1 Tax=Euplotes crassus TaxID=5936 RepID=A0AAD1Y3P8_EUPCR|nr:unnamed protein product [Moneuplotes crassus]
MRMIFKRTQQRTDTKLAPLNSIFSSSVLIHESQPNSAFKKPSQEYITPKTSTVKSSEHFQLFMELDMEYSKEHLMKPMVASQSKSSWAEQLDLQYFQSSAFCWKTHAPLQMSNKGRKRRHVHSASSIYELIYDSVLPKWKKCLKSKANRRIPKTLKARPDTIWKKILRDVREFYRMLFRARFHYLEYQDQKGAVTCIQILFSELNIPLNNNEEYLHGVFRYLHQSHKSRFPGLKEDPTPLDAIEKYNEHYRSLYMKDDFGARLLYFVFKNFTPEYCLLVKSRYQREIAEKVCMLLNCYRRMRKPEHLERIEHLLF